MPAGEGNQGDQLYDPDATGAGAGEGEGQGKFFGDFSTPEELQAHLTKVEQDRDQALHVARDLQGRAASSQDRVAKLEAVVGGGDALPPKSQEEQDHEAFAKMDPKEAQDLWVADPVLHHRMQTNHAAIERHRGSRADFEELRREEKIEAATQNIEKIFTQTGPVEWAGFKEVLPEIEQVVGETREQYEGRIELHPAFARALYLLGCERKGVQPGTVTPEGGQGTPQPQPVAVGAGVGLAGGQTPPVAPTPAEDEAHLDKVFGGARSNTIL